MAWDHWLLTTDESLVTTTGYRSRIQQEGRLAWPTVVPLIAGAGFGLKNRLWGIVAGFLPFVGIVAMTQVTAAPGAAPAG
jgi:hypothetical protein